MYIWEWKLNTEWNLSILVQTVPYLCQIRNFQKLLRSGNHKNIFYYQGNSPECHPVHSSVPKLNLQHLYMNKICFLNGHLKELLRSLKIPLEIFPITHCQFLPSDLTRYLNLHQLLHLNLNHHIFKFMYLAPAGASLLERISVALGILELEEYWM